MSLMDRAREIAAAAHDGQTDKSGAAYIDHPRRVAARVEGDPAAEVVAWLQAYTDENYRPEPKKRRRPQSFLPPEDRRS